MKFIFNLSFLIVLSCAHADTVYKRKEWHPRWADENRDCRNTRQEILISRSHVPVIFTNDKKCTVLSGKWDDYYFPETLTQAKDVDIDHLVPLFEAHKSGGVSWSVEKKRKFANDLDNLVITSKNTNRKKGANTLKTWLPVNLQYVCRYYKQWMNVKKKYSLNISPEEINSLDITKCE